MKKIASTFCLILFLIPAFQSAVQAQDLPKPSPLGTVTQVVGLTEVTITYSRPGVKDRKIWGDLVPYNKMWRTGANKATLISFSDDVKIEGNTVKAGSYSLFTIPTENEWTVVLNSETELWGTGDYNQEKDVLRVNIKPNTNCEQFERMTFTIDDMTMNSAVITLRWEKLKLPIKLEVETQEKALKNIEEATTVGWRAYSNAAQYYLNANLDNAKALEYVEKAIAGSDNYWYPVYLKAQIQAKGENYKEAIKTAEKALEIGNASENFSYGDNIGKSIKEWKEKSSS